MSDRYETRESKLPQWAQAKLERLRRTVLEQENRIAEMTGDAYRGVRMGDGQPAVFADPYLHPRVVGLVGDSFRFGVEDNNYIEVRLNPFRRGHHSLEIRGRDGRIAIAPNQSNSVTVWMEQR